MAIGGHTADLTEISDIDWYHTLELPGGIVTAGFYDTRSVLDQVPFPTSLAGKRCLDVGTSDGFFAFEMERRGAAEVVAVDIDDPARYDWPEPVPITPTRPAHQQRGANQGFETAHRLRDSSVLWTNLSVYELPNADLGKFDFVFMGTLMLHLRDPVGALSAIRTVTGTTFISVDSISLVQTMLHPFSASAHLTGHGEPRWWVPNLRAYHRMMRAAGFRVNEAGRPFFIPFGAGFPRRRPLREVGIRRLPAQVAFDLGLRHVGAPSAWVLCGPD